MASRFSRRDALAIGCSGLAANLFSGPASATAPTQNCPPLSIREIAPGVWVHTSWGIVESQCIPANGMAFVGEDRVFLIDTAWTPEQTSELLDLLRPMIAKSDLLNPRRIVNLFVSHGHADRASGLSVTAERGIPSYAFPRTMIEAARHNVGTITFALPDDRFAFDLGGRVVEVFYPGPGHTVDNAVVYDRTSKTLFGGCMVRALTATDLGNTIDADISQWSASVARAASRYPDAQIVVPGHGEPGDAALLTHTQALIGARTSRP